MPRMLRALIGFVSLAGFFLLISGQVTVTEAVAAGALAAAATLFVEAVRRTALQQFSLSGTRWARLLTSVARDLVTGTIDVARCIASRTPPHGGMQRGTADDSGDAAPAALTVLCQSVAPDRYVIGAIPGALAHRLRRSPDLAQPTQAPPTQSHDPRAAR